MSELRDWLTTTPTLALKVFAEDMPNVHGAKKADVIEFILTNSVARDRALRSKKIEDTYRRRKTD